MFKSLLIANRGEIACRIIRTARHMGIRTIAIYSRADAAALHVKMADEAVPVGPAPAIASYLDMERVLAAARASEAEAIHPGYGFLSENASFAQRCQDAGIAFIGPPPAAIAAMGLKDEAKTLMQKAGVPVTPGYHGSDQNDDRLAREADAIGYPVLIKAIAGGGGKGMRRADTSKDFSAALAAARREAKAAFGNDRVLLEKWITNPRHIEIQIMADTHGNVVHLNERDCSLQRRHQKIIEEAPAPGIRSTMREAMGKAAIQAARAVHYTGAGTVEFIVSGNDFYFMEMNTRLQVEHPVTEAITGLDLVEMQIRVAAGEPLRLAQDDVALNGHAMEARIYAEDPGNNFLPSTGTIAHLRFPDDASVRIDTGVEQGSEISPYYDPMIAKIIAHGSTRDQAREQLALALSQTEIAGPKTNVQFLQTALASKPFASGQYDTGLLDSGAIDHGKRDEATPHLLRLAALALINAHMQQQIANVQNQSSPWAVTSAFQLSGQRRQRYEFLFDGQRTHVDLEWPDGSTQPNARNGGLTTTQDLQQALDDGNIIKTDHGLFVHSGNNFIPAASLSSQPGNNNRAGDLDNIAAPMHGRITSIFVNPGDKVTAGTQLAIVEAMKMEHALSAPRDGIVESTPAAAGAQVSQGDIVVTLIKEQTRHHESAETKP